MAAIMGGMAELSSLASLDLTRSGPHSLQHNVFMFKALEGNYSRIQQLRQVSDVDWGALTAAFDARGGEVVQTFGESAVYEFHDSTAPVLVFVDRDDWDGEWTIQVASTRDDTVERWLTQFAGLVPPREYDPSSAVVPFRYWMQNTMGSASTYVHDIETPTFTDIEANYPTASRGRLAQLTRMVRPEGAGKLVLFHGPPGTGKSRFIMTLAREWAEWCSTEAVVDGERFFGDAAYMHEVLLSGMRSGDEKWRLLVLEDSDEFMDIGAKHRTGHAMSRLLNVCDGLIGHSLRVLVLLTTNVPMEKLNRAASRPGRCLSEIEFGKFGAAEARDWLDQQGLTRLDVGKGEFTLAELYAHVRRVSAVDDALGKFSDEE